MKITLLSLLLAVSLTGCGRSEREFSKLGSVTSITVSIHARDGSQYLSKISDQRELDQIVAFVNVNRANWTKPWYGIPVPSVEALLFEGESLKCSFGMGKNFFETQRGGDFFSKTASPTDVRDFLSLLCVDNETLRKLTR